MIKPLYQELASLVQARLNCLERGNHEWEHNHTNTINRLVKKYLPSGSGFDNGTTIDLDASSRNKLVFNTAFHHMNNSGYYDGWSYHTVTVTPDLAFGFDVKVGGRDRIYIKEHIAEEFNFILAEEIDTDTEYTESRPTTFLGLMVA